MPSWRLRKEREAADSEAALRPTVMSTMLPEEISGGRRMDGNSIWVGRRQLLLHLLEAGLLGLLRVNLIPWGGLTNLLSRVRRTVTPASTLPTVRETNILVVW
jgi:hypothetical protein